MHSSANRWRTIPLLFREFLILSAFLVIKNYEISVAFLILWLYSSFTESFHLYLIIFLV